MSVHDFFQAFTASAIESISKRKSAMTEFYRFTLMFFALCMVSANLLDESRRIYMFLAGMIPIGLALFGFLFLLLFDRERLHSEEHITRSKGMDLLSSKTGRISRAKSDDIVRLVEGEPSRRRKEESTREADHDN